MSTYLSFFGLREAPFRLTPDPRFFHPAEPHQAVLVSMLRAIYERCGFMILTGAIGTGKTTIIHAGLLLAEQCLPKNSLATAVLVNPALSRDEFLEAILEELEISCPVASKLRRLQALSRACLQARQRGGTTVVLIDEAHLLNSELLEEIRLLGNAETHAEKLLQIILCGQPELLSVLARPEHSALRQRIVVRSVLRPLSLSETRAYVAQRLHIAGLDAARLPFTPGAVELVFATSGGVPRLINLLCDQTLQLACEEKQTKVGPNLVQLATEELQWAKPEPVVLRDVTALSSTPAQ